MQYPECNGLVEKYRNADNQRCLPGLRRRPGQDQLGSSDSQEVLAPRMIDTSAPSIPSSPETFLMSPQDAPVKSMLAPLEMPRSDPEQERRRLKAKRTTWEASLPTNFDHHSNHVTPGHTLEYINQGVPAPKKKKEDFNVSTKHKRRYSGQ